MKGNPTKWVWGGWGVYVDLTLPCEGSNVLFKRPLAQVRLERQKKIKRRKKERDKRKATQCSTSRANDQYAPMYTVISEHVRKC